MGPPGAGKGTQAKMLVERFGMTHLSSGDIFRAERAGGSDLGRQLAEYMDSGRLVPDETVVAVMAKAITQCADGAGLLLDGFPRTVAQAEALDEQLGKAGNPLDAVIAIAVDEDKIVERITGRRSCPQCGRAYHVLFLRPKRDGECDDCGTELVQRADDCERVVRQRLEAYDSWTEPVIGYYRDCGRVKMLENDGNGTVDEVSQAVAAAVQALETDG